MSKLFKRIVCLILIAIFSIFISLSTIPANAAKGNNEKTIYLRGMEINSQKSFKSFGDFSNKVYGNGEIGPYIVTFNGPIYDSYKVELEKIGAKLVEYVPDFSFLVMMTPQNAKKIKSLSFVNNVIVYQPMFKIASDFMDNLGKIKNLGEVMVRIHTFDNVSLENEIKLMGGNRLGSGFKNTVASMNSANLLKLANMNSVKFIEPVPEFKLFNDVAKGYMGVDGIWNLGYTGEGQVVGICDTGLDTGKNDSSMHKDFQGRIDKIYALSDRGVADDPHGHGTHVAGSVLGDGTNSNGQIKGMAPKAHLVFQSVLDSSGGLRGLPNDLNTLFEQSWNAGARIHTNSWGAASNGAYETTARQVDEFVWNKDMIILFAAGNEGQSQYGGTVYNSIGTPGSAKNCITVGASENNRSEKGSYADNTNEIAAFSSRGNCKDGRIKPDIVAPGTWILSTKSSKAPGSNFWGEYNDKYAYMGGTSMATPLTAGAVAIAREYMIKEWNHTPSAAFMKAVLINGATDMGYGYMGKDQGWGRINLVDSLKSREYVYDDEGKSLSTGQTANYTYSIESKNTSLKISLVWTDYPGSTSASKALVNDLDLKITSPTGSVYYGNDFSQPFNSSFDRLNNVENIFINTPEVGDYKVEVMGYNIPQGPQPFALYATADFGKASADTEAPTCSITAPTNGATVNGTVAVSANANDNVAVTKVDFFVDGNNIGTDTTAPYAMNWDTTKVANGSHKLLVKAYDAAGNVGTSNEISVTVNNETKDTVAPTCSITAPTNAATVNGTVAVNATANDNVAVTKVDFFVDGNNIGTDTAAPYAMNWDTTKVANGSHKLLVKAYDAAGNVGTSNEISVTVNNESGGTGTEYVTESYSGSASWWGNYEKAITITAPGKITISLNTSLSVKLYDPSGTLVAKGTNSISYDATAVGKYNIVVSSSSFWGASFTLKVTYPIKSENNTDTEAPTCSIQAPANGAAVNGKVAVNAAANDNVAVTKVEFYVDGNIIGTDSTAPYGIEWDTTAVTNGSHKLFVKAYDAAGNVGTSNEITVTVNNESGGTEVDYVTETYSGYAFYFSPYEKAINVTAPGKITINLTASSSLSIKLYDSTGKLVSSGTNSISYTAAATGNYTIVVSSDWYDSFNMKVTYPIKK